MIRENTYLYKKEHKKQADEETPIHPKKSKTSLTSKSRRRSDHKHRYKKIILNYGSNTFVWGRQCEICGRVDSTYKASNWNSTDFQVEINGLYKNRRNMCLTEIHQKYPEYTIITLENAEWMEWTGKEQT